MDVTCYHTDDFPGQVSSSIVTLSIKFTKKAIKFLQMNQNRRLQGVSNDKILEIKKITQEIKNYTK